MILGSTWSLLGGRQRCIPCITPSQGENFKLAWLPYLILTKKLKLLIPRGLENGGFICRVEGSVLARVRVMQPWPTL